MAASQIEWYTERLQSVYPDTTVRAMFGGHGFFRDGIMYALEAYDILYLKCDRENLAEFEAAGCEPFVYTDKGREMRMSYREIPPHALEDNDQLPVWVKSGFAAALRNRKKATAASRKPKSGPEPDSKPNKTKEKKHKQK